MGTSCYMIHARNMHRAHTETGCQESSANEFRIVCYQINVNSHGTEMRMRSTIRALRSIECSKCHYNGIRTPCISLSLFECLFKCLFEYFVFYWSAFIVKVSLLKSLNAYSLILSVHWAYTDGMLNLQKAFVWASTSYRIIRVRMPNLRPK